LGSANGPWEANKSDQITFRGEAPGTGTLIDKDTLIIAANGVAMKLTRVQPDSAQVCTPELEICRLTYPITLHLGAAKKPMKEYSIYQPDMVALNWTVDPQIKKYSICEVKLLPAPGTKLQEVRLANARNIPAAQRSIPPFLFDSVAPGKYLLRLTAFCVGDVTVTSEVMLNVKSAVKTQAGVHDIQPNGDIQVISIVQAPNVHEEIITHSFIGSDFAHTEKMYDENGAEVEYCESHEGNIYRYQATLNKPIPKGETLFLGSKGWWEGVVNKVADNEYRYRMNHTPGGNVPIRRVEIFRLPKGAGLLETTPADLPHHMRNGQIEILVDTVIPIGGSLLTEFRYRHEGLQNVPDPEPMALYSKAKKLEVNVKSSSRKGRFICRSNVEESKELEGEYETPMTLVCTQKRLDITIVPVDGAPVSGELVINGNRRATWEGTDPERIRAGKTMEGVSVDLR
ncbi:MAG: hypothetical protein KAU94_05395, partial [Verrucomicrobia bacterium]|nr:hypothetical protein [Verrucomicrobiota bacterium]